MKKIILALTILAVTATSCSTVQSIVRSAFPYTATLMIPASTKTNTSLSAVSSASSFDQIFTGQGSNTNVSEVRIASARIDASNPTNQSLGVFRSVRLYLSRGDGSGEVLVASRNDVSETTGSSLVFDVDNSKFLDELVRNSTVRVRLEYVLRNSLSTDISIRASIGFNSSPITAR